MAQLITQKGPFEALPRGLEANPMHLKKDFVLDEMADLRQVKIEARCNLVEGAGRRKKTCRNAAS